MSSDNDTKISASKNVQRELFEISDGKGSTEFKVYTNVLDIWDLLPKYDVWGHSKRYHSELDIHERVRKIPVRHQVHRDNLISDTDSFIELELHIEPALIERKCRDWVTTEEKNGKKTRKRAYERDEHGNYITEPVYVFPGLREDRLESCLIYCLSHGQGNFTSERTGVTFSIKQLQRELKRTGSAMSLDEIKEGLEVLSRAQCVIYGLDVEGRRKSVMGSTFLPNLMMIDRNTYKSKLAAGEETHCYAQFHMMVTMGIQNNQFRITNYEKHQRLENLFSRHLHKVLRTRFLNASRHGHPYRLSTNKAMEEFGRDVTRKDNTRIIMITAFKDLTRQGVLTHFIEEEPERDARDRRVVLDRTFLLFPTEEFIQEMIDSNVRYKRNFELFDDFSNTMALSEQSRKLTKEEDLARKELNEWNIPTRKALKLIQSYPLMLIRKCLTDVRTKHQAGKVKSPSGYILTALEEGWYQDNTVGIGKDLSAQEESVTPNQMFLDQLSQSVQNKLHREWDSWPLSSHQAFNEYGTSSPYIRELLGLPV